VHIPSPYRDEPSPFWRAGTPYLDLQYSLTSSAWFMTKTFYEIDLKTSHSLEQRPSSPRVAVSPRHRVVRQAH